MKVDKMSYPSTDEVYLREHKGGKVLIGTHTGAYNQAERSYNQLMWHMEANGMEWMGYPIDMYMNDPASTKEEDLVTMIYVPI